MTRYSPFGRSSIHSRQGERKFTFTIQHWTIKLQRLYPFPASERDETESYKRSSVESKGYGNKREPAEGGSCAAAVHPTPLLKESREASGAGWRQRQARLVILHMILFWYIPTFSRPRYSWWSPDSWFSDNVDIFCKKSHRKILPEQKVMAYPEKSFFFGFLPTWDLLL